MKKTAIIQARMGSSRFPGKVLASLGHMTVLDYVVKRCQLSKSLDGVLLATSNLPLDDPIQNFAESCSIPLFRGSEKNVLRRYIEAAKKFSIDTIVRITADCPLIDPAIIDQNLELYENELPDYAFVEGYPNGLGAAEVLALPALKRTLSELSQEDDSHREHVMTYMLAHPTKFKLAIRTIDGPLYRPELRTCVDEPADLELIRKICEHFSPRIDFGSHEIIAYLDENPHLKEINCHIMQNKV